MHEKCCICGNVVEINKNVSGNTCFYACPICGRYEISTLSINSLNKNRLGPYLTYHKFEAEDDKERRFNSNVKDDEVSVGEENIEAVSVYFDEDVVDAWYPRALNQKIDLALLYLNGKTNHIGQIISMTRLELESVFFIDRYENEKKTFRDEESRKKELDYFKEILVDKKYISVIGEQSDSEVGIQIKPDGYNRIDDLLKYSANGKTVLVAMKFGNETQKLREAIRKGISDAGYNATFIDEVEHNNLITPELLHYIRSSKFVVVDLTHQNNGAYFEEGYALGLGKPVIQLCQKGTTLHFDIAQKNTIIWDTEEDIPDRLKNRIHATIE